MPYRDNARQTSTLDWSRIPYQVCYVNLVSVDGVWHLDKRSTHHRWYWTAWLAAWWHTRNNAWGQAKILQR